MSLSCSSYKISDAEEELDRQNINVSSVKKVLFEYLRFYNMPTIYVIQMYVRPSSPLGKHPPNCNFLQPQPLALLVFFALSAGLRN